MHVNAIAEAGARNDERQAVFVELRDMMARLDALYETEEDPRLDGGKDFTGCDV